MPHVRRAVRRRKNPGAAVNRPGANPTQAVRPECDHARAILAEPPPFRKAVSVNVLPREQQLEALHLLVEGVSLRSVTRLTRVHRTAAMRLMVRAGNQLRRFLDERMRGLHLRHVQWTKFGLVLKKQARLAPAEADDPTIGDQFLFIALDEDTKLVPSFLVG